MSCDVYRKNADFFADFLFFQSTLNPLGTAAKRNGFAFVSNSKIFSKIVKNLKKIQNYF